MTAQRKLKEPSHKKSMILDNIHPWNFVNSRMDSTGVEEKIQVNERTKNVLNQWYEFEERGDIFVKGKDIMKVFLYTSKKESAIRMF